MGALEGRRTLVTGGGRGIGEAIARTLADAGAKVLVVARTETEIRRTAEAITAAGGQAASMTCDITSDASVDELAAAAPELLGGPVDTLVNNAGVYKPARFMDHSLDDWRWVLDVNVLATVRMTRAFLPAMTELERSRVILIASIAGKKGSFGQSAYNASKHAQIGLMRCLALEYGSTSVRVNAVCPGFVHTDLIATDEIGAVHGKEPEVMRRDIEAASTIGRTVTVEEVAAATLYLASPSADAINGQSLAVDGGITY